jgi:glutamate dehydrogenase/leucine dehydrogenase
MPSGFDKYQAFYERPATIVVEWRDRETPAVGWLAIDSLRGGAAGGGTRMRAGGTQQEAVFLAKTMGVKFCVAGPEIGGGKSVIDFDYDKYPAEVKRGVLERWYRHIGPYLKNCYGTGGDIGVDEVSEATAIIERIVGNKHPQEGIARGHTWSDSEGPGPKIERLKHGVEALVVLPDLPGPRDGKWMIADVVTGFGVVRAVERYYKQRGLKLEGQRAIIEGFGAVGAFAAYYLEKLGVVTVAASSRGANRTTRVARDGKGLDVKALILARQGTELPAPGKEHPQIVDSVSGDELFEHKAEIYIPGAISHSTNAARMDAMRRCGVKVVSCGANNPFAYDRSKSDLKSWVTDMLALQKVADKEFAIIPDFVANCGMARTFGYLMAAGGKTDAASILADSGARIDGAVDRLLDGHSAANGLLERGYSAFIPE